MNQIFNHILISPLTGFELKRNNKIYQSNSGEVYPIINDIPIIIKDDFKLYNESNYNKDFKYFNFWDKSFIKNITKKLKIKKKSLLLDVGAGEGFYSKCFNDLGINTIPADFSKYMLEKGKLKYPELDFIAIDANNIPFKNEVFDVIFCSGLSLFNSENYSKQSILLDHLMSKLKLGGILIFIHTTNLTGKSPSSWNNFTYNFLDTLFKKYKIKYKWFIPRFLVLNIFNQLSFTIFSTNFFSFLIKNLSFIHNKIRGRLIYVVIK